NPQATTSADYQSELAEVKQAQAQLSEQQNATIKYWSAGGVLRWNEIMRELVAKYNLPPYQNEDGTYPIPSSANPFQYPYFPFSNPPYAARAYAYVSVAQYDAMVAAWQFKKQFNRAKPSQIDPSIRLISNETQLPAYPSEEATMSSVSLEMLKLLFPTEIDFLTLKAEEQKNVALWTGRAVKSDLTAGTELGKAIANKVIARVKSDGMGAAVGNVSIWKKLEDDIVAKGETPWISLESPKRPPMLPVFGKVKTWLFDDAEVIKLRPATPPSTKSLQMQQEIQMVKEATDNLDREKIRMVHFWADGAGTYTPPGHWNAIAADFVNQAQFSDIRTARTFALLNMAMMDAAVCCWDTKYLYFFPRPSQLDASIKTVTGVPNFPAYTSGHSTFSGAAATILGYLFPSQKTAVEKMAEEASISRLYGGIHYKMDCEIGLRCGKSIGEYAIRRAKIDGGE
ncbi:MAG: phosphatase PAP2 family protein, partial [Bacteroidetes bacterium]